MCVKVTVHDLHCADHEGEAEASATETSKAEAEVPAAEATGTYVFDATARVILARNYLIGGFPDNLIFQGAVPISVAVPV